MHPPDSHRRGFALAELLVVLVLLGILLSLAAPRFNHFLDALRGRRALDHLAAELYRVRMQAVEQGRTMSLVLNSAEGCVVGVTLHTGAHPTAGLAPLLTTPILDVPRPCLRHSGDSILVFNSRGMLLPPTRSIYTIGAISHDSLLISIAGRLRRSF